MKPLTVPGIKSHILRCVVMAMGGFMFQSWAGSVVAGNHVHPVAGTNLTTIEEADIRYVREEEQLARDVYIKLYDLWGLRIFDNISAAEQNHMDAMAVLMGNYGLDDPANAQTGVFQDLHIQELYNEFIERGAQSPESALRVGGAIEETDIIDFILRATHTDKADILFTYDNLLKGSRNHLRSFVSVMEGFGIEYVPQYLSLEEYDQIINGARGKSVLE